MSTTKIGVGVVGASPGRGWATRAHLPAIAASPDFALRAVATSRPESAKEASAEFGVPGYADVQTLVADPAVDFVVISVKVPLHAALIRACLKSRKPTLCEWPLARNLLEARDLTAESASTGVRTFIGLQARSSPGLNFVRSLIQDGFLGEVLSTSMIGSAGSWGATISEADAYLLDKATGASMLTIPFGHFFDALSYALGDVASVTAATATRRTFAREEQTGREVPFTVADQIVVGARLKSGAIASIHYRGGLSAGTNCLWEINGTEGDLVVTAANGHLQMRELTVCGARKGEVLQLLSIPASFRQTASGTSEGVAQNVAEAYSLIAQDLQDSGHRTPDFNDAVRLHTTLDAIERSAASGQREHLDFAIPFHPQMPEALWRSSTQQANHKTKGQ